MFSSVDWFACERKGGFVGVLSAVDGVNSLAGVGVGV